MGWPQLTWLVLVSLTAGIHLAYHGRPREDFYSAWYALIGAAINGGLLYAGGFFN